MLHQHECVHITNWKNKNESSIIKLKMAYIWTICDALEC